MHISGRDRPLLPIYQVLSYTIFVLVSGDTNESADGRDRDE